MLKKIILTYSGRSFITASFVINRNNLPFSTSWKE